MTSTAPSRYTINEHIHQIELRKNNVEVCCTDKTYTFNYELYENNCGIICCDHLKYLSVDFVFE